MRVALTLIVLLSCCLATLSSKESFSDHFLAVHINVPVHKVSDGKVHDPNWDGVSVQDNETYHSNYTRDDQEAESAAEGGEAEKKEESKEAKDSSFAAVHVNVPVHKVSGEKVHDPKWDEKSIQDNKTYHSNYTRDDQEVESAAEGEEAEKKEESKEAKDSSFAAVHVNVPVHKVSGGKVHDPNWDEKSIQDNKTYHSNYTRDDQEVESAAKGEEAEKKADEAEENSEEVEGNSFAEHLSAPARRLSVVKEHNGGQ